MDENDMVQDEEISLFDLWQKLQYGWRYVVGGAVIGLLGAALAITLIPPKYEAMAVVQVGQLGQFKFAPLGQVEQLPSLPVEPATQAVERMKTPAFQLSVAERLGSQTWIDALQRSSNAATANLSPQVVKATIGQGALSLIELKATSDSAENAKKIADAAVFELAQRHSEIAKPMIEKMRLDLTIAKEKLASAEKELEGLNKLVANAMVKDDRFTQLSLMTSLRVQKEAELFSQRQMVIALETALNAPATQPAKAIEAVFATDTPVSPKKGLLLALGLVGGLFAGVISVFFVAAWRRAKEGR